MRLFYLTALLFVFFLFHPVDNARAAIWVEQINGNSAAVIISRKGNFLKVEEMMRLKSGDVIKVLDGKTTLRILLGTGAIKSVTKARSPFIVNGASQSNSFLGNLMTEVKKMLVASSEQTEAVTMASRGRSKTLVILASGVDENMVLASSKTIIVSWRGGKAPYKISLIHPDKDEPVLSRAGVMSHQLALETGKITSSAPVAGEYELVVEDANTGSPASNDVNITFVEHNRLPPEAQKLLKLGLDKRVEARFLINLLHKMPEWRFFSYNLAVHFGLKKERQALAKLK